MSDFNEEPQTVAPAREFDPVNNPAHYTDSKIEVIDFIDDKELGYSLGNAVKYISRAGKKKSVGKTVEEKEIEDLRKAVWYINHRIIQVESQMAQIAHPLSESMSMQNKNDAMQYLDGEIGHMSIMLDGILTDEYRHFLLAKRRLFRISYDLMSQLTEEEYKDLTLGNEGEES